MSPIGLLWSTDQPTSGHAVVDLAMKRTREHGGPTMDTDHDKEVSRRCQEVSGNDASVTMRSSGNSSSDVLSIAPMIQWTDRHWRFYMRCITKKTWLYTEMIMDNALYYNATKLEPFLGHNPCEQPLAVQLGGNDPIRLGEAAALCESFGSFSEINLNSGCPSNKAKKAGFGAELMLEPELVRQITHEMKRRATNTDITVKCRIGVTGRESWDNLIEYVAAVKSSGVTKMIIHARSCVLKGLSPAQNRTIPPLQYEVAHRLVQSFPDMRFIPNGGITDFETAKRHVGMCSSVKLYDVNGIDELPYMHGAMIGREAYNNPFLFQTADSEFFDIPMSDCPPLNRQQVLEQYLDYVEEVQEKKEYYGYKTCLIVKPLHNIFYGCPSNHLYKQKLDSLLIKCSAKIDNGEMLFRDMIVAAMEDTIPLSFLRQSGADSIV
jgi:tRNA-dihydrouridine synthase A